MATTRIHVFHTGNVCIAPDLAFAEGHSNVIKASGVFLPPEKRVWMPLFGGNPGPMPFRLPQAHILR